MKKQITGELKELSERGEGLVVIATLHQPDKDRDLTMPGFFGRQYAPMVPTHDWHHVPLGKGTIFEQGAEVVYQFRLNLDIQAAKDWYSQLKFDLANPPSLQEYSYGFSLHPDGWELSQHEGHQIRRLKARPDGTPGAKVHEVSPVLVGAGVGTHTVDVKVTPETIEERLADERKADGFQVQTLIFPKDKWESAEDCRAWCRSHDFSAGEVDDTESSYRFRQKDPGAFERLRTICLAPNRDTAPEDCRVQAVGGPTKSAHRGNSKQTVQEVFDATMSWIDDLVATFERHKASREQEGRGLSTPHLEKIATLAERLHALERSVKTETADPQVVSALFERFQSLTTPSMK